MKRKIPNIIALLLLLFGVALLLYPTISNYLYQKNATTVIQEYNYTVEQMTNDSKLEMLSKANSYNQMLTGTNIKDPFIPDSGFAIPEEYDSILNIQGMIGYLEIPQINVYLPIYHGTNDKILKKGVGHMEATAFPIGGEGNHSVLTGHRGLPSAELLSNLDKLELNDVFYIYILDEVFAYQVDQILVVNPNETDELRPIYGEDYLTIITCTPYAINSHRLFVRGIRIPYEPNLDLTGRIGLTRNQILLSGVSILITIVLLQKIKMKKLNHLKIKD